MKKDQAKEPQVEVTPKPIDVNDIDASWDGKGSLDDHRQKALKQVKELGFGAARKANTDGRRDHKQAANQSDQWIAQTRFQPGHDHN